MRLFTLATNSDELGQSERHYIHHYYMPAMTSVFCRVPVACSSYNGSCWDNKTLLVSLKPSLFCELIEHVQQTSMMRCRFQYRHMFDWKFLIHALETCLQTLRLIKCYKRTNTNYCRCMSMCKGQLMSALLPASESQI